MERISLDIDGITDAMQWSVNARGSSEVNIPRVVFSQSLEPGPHTVKLTKTSPANVIMSFWWVCGLFPAGPLSHYRQLLTYYCHTLSGAFSE